MTDKPGNRWEEIVGWAKLIASLAVGFGLTIWAPI
jgi:hypothetical protein